MSEHPPSMSPVRGPMVRYTDETEPVACSYGEVRRVFTGGAGGVANVHVVCVTRGNPHVHVGYDEVYHVLAGEGVLVLGEARHALRPGAVAVIPAGTVHSVEAAGEAPLEFVIFGVPALPVDDARVRPRRVD